jgi:hypothetical protein
MHFRYYKRGDLVGTQKRFAPFEIGFLKGSNTVSVAAVESADKMKLIIKQIFSFKRIKILMSL